MKLQAILFECFMAESHNIIFSKSCHFQTGGEPIDDERMISSYGQILREMKKTVGNNSFFPMARELGFLEIAAVRFGKYLMTETDTQKGGCSFGNDFEKIWSIIRISGSRSDHYPIVII